MTANHTKDDDRRKTQFNILLIEDNATDALLIQSHVETLADFSLQTVATLSQALACLDSQDFDAILLDLNLPDALGLESLIKLRRHVQRAPIVVLTGINDKELGIMALQRGAQDYLIKGVDNGRLMESIRYAIERVVINESPGPTVSQQSRIISAIEGNKKSDQHLTERELQVLKLLGTGCSNQEIADSLGISLATAKTHMVSILQKLSVSDRTKAVIQAQHQGLI